jgi:hypothetical protein
MDVAVLVVLERQLTPAEAVGVAQELDEDPVLAHEERLEVGVRDLEQADHLLARGREAARRRLEAEDLAVELRRRLDVGNADGQVGECRV